MPDLTIYSITLAPVDSNVTCTLSFSILYSIYAVAIQIHFIYIGRSFSFPTPSWLTVVNTQGLITLTL